MKILAWLLLFASVPILASPITAKAGKRKSTSGIYGRVMVWGLPPSPAGLAAYIPNCEVTVKRAQDKKEVRRVRANRYGNFTITLPPGKYIVVPYHPKPREIGAFRAEETQVSVWRGFYTETEARWDGGW